MSGPWAMLIVYVCREKSSKERMEQPDTTVTQVYAINELIRTYKGIIPQIVRVDLLAILSEKMSTGQIAWRSSAGTLSQLTRFVPEPVS